MWMTPAHSCMASKPCGTAQPWCHEHSRRDAFCSRTLSIGGRFEGQPLAQAVGNLSEKKPRCRDSNELNTIPAEVGVYRVPVLCRHLLAKLAFGPHQFHNPMAVSEGDPPRPLEQNRRRRYP